MKTLILTLALCLSADLFAREIKLATITGNIDTDTSTFSVEIDDSGKLHTVLFRTVTKEGRVTQDSRFAAETVVDEGVVLLERDGRKVLKLQTEAPFSLENGGIVKMNYLYSGVSGSWKTLKVSLAKPEGEFQIMNLKGEKVTRFFTKGNWHPIFGLIGIADLVPQP
ncbi:MAG: hypothetical protein V4598_04275 [Bdellovibrionota bacterium]